MTSTTGAGRSQHGGLVARVMEELGRSAELAGGHAPRGESGDRPDDAAVERERIRRARRAVKRERASASASTASRPVRARPGRVGEGAGTSAGVARLEPPGHG